jgi:DNA-binding response OmpR family regulator
MKERARILVVDPDEQERELVAATMKLLGAEYEWCSSGEEGLRRVAAERFDAILLDILMSDNSGYELCRALKADRETADIPILFATTRHRAEDVLDGFQTLAFDFLVKPYRPRELRARLHNALRLKALLEEMKARVRYHERVLRLGRGLANAKDPIDAEKTIEEELTELIGAFKAGGVVLDVGGRTLFSVGDASGPIAADIPFGESGVEGSFRLYRAAPADSEECVRLADFSATLARGVSRHGLHLRAVSSTPQ